MKNVEVTYLHAPAEDHGKTAPGMGMYPYLAELPIGDPCLERVPTGEHFGIAGRGL